MGSASDSGSDFAIAGGHTRLTQPRRYGQSFCARGVLLL
jgi:hypothetical protein